jgi:diguanylate cyclase (GGDEF)-like protein
MVPNERALPAWDFALPTANQPRAFWARVQQRLKRFLTGAPEQALLRTHATERAGTHLAAVLLLTLPLGFAWLPGSSIGRWTVFFSLISGLLVALRLELAERARANPVTVVIASAVYAVSLSGVAWELLGPAALRVDPSHALAAVVAVLGVLAMGSDPRLSALAGGVGVLSIGALYAFGGDGSAGGAPALIAASGASVASVFAAARGQQLERLATLDGASGALRADAFETCLRRAQQTARAAAQPITLAKLEFTALREIRETHGNAFADALLRWLATVLADRFRATDLIGRSGQDEFSLALLDADHPGVERRLERLREDLDTIELSRGGLREPVVLRVAYGIAALPREALDAGGAQRLADQRLALARWRARHPA